ncbi:MAG: Hsp20/alpha crystallin family protein [Deltaproteobacteria bacterium]|nr:Hsp20/alpha crystallin family protein [Deltaproteobacteria bacterium]
MTDSEAKALQAREKAEVATSGEQLKPGLVFSPAIDIFETDKELTLVADIPGVKAGNLNIDLKEDVLSLSGEVEPPEAANEVDLLREYRTGRYFREFRLGQMVDQSKIDAELKDGVLCLRLPKVERAAPRKIAVKAG